MQQVGGLMPAVPSQRDEFRAIYRSTLADVYGYLLAHTGGNRALAEDITAETYLHATRHFAKGGGAEVTIAWLKTVARRRLVDHWRREERIRNRAARLEEELVLSTTSSDHAERLAVHDALGQMPDIQRLVLTLKHVDGLRVAEIADLLDRSPKSIESLLTRARATFREVYPTDG